MTFQIHMWVTQAMRRQIRMAAAITHMPSAEFIRRAITSALQDLRAEDDFYDYLIDAAANPGFKIPKPPRHSE